jgi:hypothetical protein
MSINRINPLLELDSVALRTIGEQLLTLSDMINDRGDSPPSPAESSAQSDRQLAGLAAMARQIHRFRLRRSRYLPASLFREPAWDMLLDLFVCASEHRAVSTMDVTLASGAPATTALRWIGQLEQEGLIARRQHELDQRVTLVEMTPKAKVAMREFLSDFAKSVLPTMLLNSASPIA